MASETSSRDGARLTRAEAGWAEVGWAEGVVAWRCRMREPPTPSFRLEGVAAYTGTARNDASAQNRGAGETGREGERREEMIREGEDTIADSSVGGARSIDGRSRPSLVSCYPSASTQPPLRIWLDGGLLISCPLGSNGIR